MSALGRTVGVAGFVFSVGIACTQLFGDRQNTLAPVTAPKKPTTATPMLEPGGPEDPEEICAVGQSRCDGSSLQTCTDDRTSWVTVQRCGAAALCQATPAACLAATCTAEEMSCNGAVLQKCNADRTGWDVFDTCLSSAHCNANQRRCLPEACNPGERRCDRSDVDHSPVLEVCRGDRTDWASLDACVTRELCDQTLTGGSPGGLVVGSDGMLQVGAVATPDTVQKCNLPACAVGEVRCEGARLEFCSEGRTGWVTAEECASEALCSASLNSTGSTSTPVCLPPVCDVGQHNCTDTGVLQSCSDDRTGFRDLEACIGASFCNAVLADQGQPGCRDAPCEAGQMQCNGAQIQVCRDDRTALDETGAPCASAALCNAADPSNAFCEPPVCHRGATAGDEFRCEDGQLQRCNESLTAYESVQTCDARQRSAGCKAPACQRGQHNCRDGFLQTCNADQTALDNTENCASQAQCDANAGRCADPCVPGSTRCNSTTGDLEQCRDRLIGWQPIADCQSLALCDAADGRCNICLDGQFSCADNQLRQCAPDGRTFVRQNVGPECASVPNGGVGVRICQDNRVVVNSCPFGCTNGRCNECQANSTRCAGSQVQRCVNGFFAAPTSCSDGNACNGAESCQGNNCTGGAAPNCNDNNPCSSDSCNPATGCRHDNTLNSAQCVNNNTQVQSCDNGQLQVSNCNLGFGCNGGRCNNCNQGTCRNGTQFQTCDNGQLSAPRNCPADNLCQGNGDCVFDCQQFNCNDNNPCTNDTCTAQQGCVHTNNANACSDNNACTTGDTCRNGSCQAGAAVSCAAAGACKVTACSTQTGVCTTSNSPDNTPCAGGRCRAGTCTPDLVCTPGAITCSGTTAVTCNAAGSAATSRNCAGTATPVCTPGRGCVECVANADCNGRVAANQCRRAQCTQFTCISAVLTGAACNDGFGCNGPDSCRASGECLSDGPFVECPHPACSDFSGCAEDGSGRAACFATPPSRMGAFCTTATGARGNCTGTGVGAAFCDARLPCSGSGDCPPNAPSCNSGFCGPIIIE